MELNFTEFNQKTNLRDQREMFALCFPETNGSSIQSNEHYFWKFHSFPNSPNSFEYSVYEESSILGYYAAIPYKYNINGNLLTAGMVCDVMTHPKARGKGVFTKIGRFATDSMKQEGVHFTTGYPIRPEVIPGHLKVGWKDAFQLPMYLRPIKSNDILSSKNLGLLAPIVNLALFFFNSFINFFASKPSSYSFEVLTLNQLSMQKDFYNKFRQEWENNQNYFLDKNLDFLKWRLGSSPDSYSILIVRNEKKEIKALSIVKKENLNDISTLALLDLMGGDDTKALSFLMLNCFKYAKSVKAEVLALMLSIPWAKKYKLLKHGFLKSPFVFTFITKPLNLDVELDQFYDENNWHLSWIDSDDL